MAGVEGHSWFGEKRRAVADIADRTEPADHTRPAAVGMLAAVEDKVLVLAGMVQGRRRMGPRDDQMPSPQLPLPRTPRMAAGDTAGADRPGPGGDTGLVEQEGSRAGGSPAAHKGALRNKPRQMHDHKAHLRLGGVGLAVWVCGGAQCKGEGGLVHTRMGSAPCWP